ncbi:MAG: hypothetical protein Q4D42_08615, partial [Eubacteriales bacterium]|nr:hypothetical protein [Eubacteriales bacterium]
KQFILYFLCILSNFIETYSSLPSANPLAILAWFAERFTLCIGIKYVDPAAPLQLHNSVA